PDGHHGHDHRAHHRHQSERDRHPGVEQRPPPPLRRDHRRRSHAGHAHARERTDGYGERAPGDERLGDAHELRGHQEPGDRDLRHQQRLLDALRLHDLEQPRDDRPRRDVDRFLGRDREQHDLLEQHRGARGAAYIYTASDDSHTDSITGSTFSLNGSTNSGGALYIASDTVTINAPTFDRNAPARGLEGGGGIDTQALGAGSVL